MNVCLSMTMHEYVWLCMAMFDFIWLCMTRMTVYDNVQQSMTLND